MAPAGTVVTVYLRHDGHVEPSWWAALESWAPSIGGGRTAGMGRARLHRLAWGALDLTTAAGLRTWLERSGPGLVEAVATTERTVRAGDFKPLIEARLRIVDGLLVAGDRDGDVTRARRQGDVPVIDGSSLKGALRTRAEFILRSVGVAVCPGACGACRCCRMFGAPGRRGAVGVRSATVEGGTFEKRNHVAIDRVTGGARKHLLFEDEVVVGGEFVMTIDKLGRAEPWMRDLLLWVVRDLHDGLWGLGSRVTRGLGTVELVDPAFVGDLPSLSSIVAAAQ